MAAGEQVSCHIDGTVLAEQKGERFFRTCP